MTDLVITNDSDFIDATSFFIQHPDDMTYTLVQAVPFPCSLTNLKLKTSTGTCTVAIQIDGVSVTGLDSLAVTSAEQSFDATALNTAALDTTITMVVSATSLAANLSGSLKSQRS